MLKPTTAVALALLCAGAVQPARAQGWRLECLASDDVCRRATAYVLTNVKPLFSDAALVDAINTQNATFAKITNIQINTMDNGWSDRSDKKLIESRMHNSVSDLLRQTKDAGKGTIFEIFVFDNHGLNVAQTDVTQDFNQGDEAKYWKTYGTASDAIFIDKVAPDDGRNISQVSLTIKDPKTGQAIGAATIGIDVDKLN